MLVALLLGAAGFATPRALAAPPPAVVFDTDVDFDDAAALAYLAAEDHAGVIRLRAVTVENNAANVAPLAATEAKCLLDRFGLHGVPVAGGPIGLPVFPSLTAGVTAIMATLVPPCGELALPGDPAAGAKLIATIAREEPDLRILATGSMTNLAGALAREPAVARATQITVNGGDFSGKADPFLDEGLLRDGTQAYNFSADPQAARAVVAAAPPSLFLVTDGATTSAPMTPAFAARLKAQARTPEAKFVSSVANHPVIVAEQALTHAAFWWDPVTAVAADRPDIVDHHADPIVVRTDGKAAGRTEVGGGGPPVAYALHADAAAFEDQFLRVLNGG
jgi:inosine-uridine nucleoside N-ribohydrolase